MSAWTFVSLVFLFGGVLVTPQHEKAGLTFIGIGAGTYLVSTAAKSGSEDYKLNKHQQHGDWLKTYDELVPDYRWELAFIAPERKN